MFLYLQKNESATPENKQPVLRLSVVDDDGNFTEIGALWKAKSGKGFSGKVKDGVKIDVSGVEPYVSDGEKSVDEAFDDF